MQLHPTLRRGAFLTLGLMLFLGTSSAHALCGCPSDGNGAPKAATGLGQSFPLAQDLAPDPAWQVYVFERDGLRYTQVNDATGNVRAAVGQIGQTLWVMPIGSDADRVSVPGDALPAGQSRVLVDSSEAEVILYQDGTRQGWLIRAPSSDH